LSSVSKVTKVSSVSARNSQACVQLCSVAAVDFKKELAATASPELLVELLLNSLEIPDGDREIDVRCPLSLAKNSAMNLKAFLRESRNYSH